MQQESLAKTLSIAFIVILFCALLVSSAVVYLRPLQAANEAPLSYRNILEVAGLVGQRTSKTSEEDMLALFQQIETQLLDLNTSRATTQYQHNQLNFRSSSNDPQTSIVIEKKFDKAMIQRRPNKIPVYWVHSDETTTKLVLPIYGKGMWSMIYGYIALEQDLNTISGIGFYEQGDTPGIGEKIQEKRWLAQWQGKKLYDENNELALNVDSKIKKFGEKNFQIDGISGATKTVNGVFNIIHYWFGSQGYRTFLIEHKS